jgi:Cof subfamily protein (haloacid dehalogenase superfamily)
LIHHKDNKNVIYNDVVEELHRSIEGKHFSIATGRHYKDVLSIAKKFNINMPANSFVIGANGCQIYSVDEASLILNKTLATDIVQVEVPKIISYLDNALPNGTLIFAYGKDENIYFVKNNSSQFQTMVDAVLTHEDNDGVFNYSIVETVKELKDITKFCIDFLNKIEDPLLLIENLKKICDKVDFANTGEKFIEVIIKGVNKSTALEYINENHYKLDQKEILVFGDSGNDVEMMDYAGTSITRHDSRPEIQTRATMIFPGGASKFVKNALIELIK